MPYTDNLWLKELATDNGWIKQQIRSFNARLGDAVVGGRRAPLPADMIAWHAEILGVRAKYAQGEGVLYLNPSSEDSEGE